MALSENMILESDQFEHLLDEALKIVRTEAFEMKRSLDKGLQIEAFKHASTMLSELRTSALSPKFYYRLYVDIINELNHLSTFLVDDSNNENRLQRFAEFYEVVQYAGNIVPRLYLLITVGVIYFKMEGAPKKEILKDLVEMNRGVQNPIRGLFLRNYLLTCTKELLPDTPPDDDSNPAGTVNDAVEFIMLNFSEMNKLWVRMQYAGPSKDREKREKERRELRILVGTNLVRLSQLENLTFDMYSRIVLPGILEQAVSCKEAISQEYLMECVIQVFPDEYHLSTLSEFLDACAELNPDVQVKNILNALIERLAIYAVAEDSPGIPEDVQLFEIFSTHAGNVIGARENMPPEDIIAIQSSLIHLAIKCYPERTDYANTVVDSTCKLLKNQKIQSAAPNSNVGKELIKLLKIPIDQHKDIVKLLDISELPNLIQLLNFRGRAIISSYIINSILDNENSLTEEEHINGIFKLIETLVEEELPEDVEIDESFKEQQELVAKLVTAIHSDDLDKHFTLLKTARKHFGKGGKHRLPFTLPPLVFATYKLALRYQNNNNQDDWDNKINQLFVFAMKTINALKTESEWSSLGLKLYLQGAIASDQIQYENSDTVTYEFVSKAISIYEEDIHESKEQVLIVHLLIGSIQRLVSLTEENLDPLTSKCAVLAAKLLKKQDQAQAVCKVAHLFWHCQIAGHDGPMRDSVRVNECLRKALRIASQCMDDLVQISLFNHILNENLYFIERGCTDIKLEEVNKLIDKIRDSVYQLDRTPEAEVVIEAFNKTIAFIQQKQSESSEEPYASLQGILAQ
jgi:vacuolar protein sorting-associated protein 35